MPQVLGFVFNKLIKKKIILVVNILESKDNNECYNLHSFLYKNKSTLKYLVQKYHFQYNIENVQ